LEDPDAEKTQEFVEQLNAISKPFLNATPVREQIHARFLNLIDSLHYIIY
jgi:prolyl oligopeptidase PreP (S9A serine peptidase family)